MTATRTVDEDAKLARLQRQRAREASSVVEAPLANRFETAVVGLTFHPRYPDSVLNLHAQLQYANRIGEPIRARLVPNPGNVHDANAVEVHVSAIGDDGPVGHLPAALARRMSPLLQAGEEWQAKVVDVRVSERDPDRPGLVIAIRRKPR